MKKEEKKVVKTTCFHELQKYVFHTDDQQEHFVAVNGWRYALVLRKIDEHLRNKVKYSRLSTKTEEACEEIRDMIRAELDSDGLSLEDVP